MVEFISLVGQLIRLMKVPGTGRLTFRRNFAVFSSICCSLPSIAPFSSILRIQTKRCSFNMYSSKISSIVSKPSLVSTKLSFPNSLCTLRNSNGSVVHERGALKALLPSQNHNRQFSSSTFKFQESVGQRFNKDKREGGKLATEFAKGNSSENAARANHTSAHRPESAIPSGPKNQTSKVRYDEGEEWLVGKE